MSMFVSLTTRPFPEPAVGGTGYLLPIDVGTPRERALVWLATTAEGLLLRGSCDDRSPGWCFHASLASSSLEDIVGDEARGYRPELEGVSSWWTDDVVLPARREDAEAEHDGSLPYERVALGLLAPPQWAEVGGAAGVLGAACGPWRDLIAPYGFAFALDLHAHTSDSPSRLHLGPFNNSRGLLGAAGPIQWGYMQVRPPIAVDLFEPSICGASLLGTTSGHWPAIVNTSEPCLVLPYALHEALFAWLAVADCTKAVSQRCTVPAALATSLPVLTFRLAQHAVMLQLPLEALLLSDAEVPLPNGARELCIRRAEDEQAAAADGGEASNGNVNGDASGHSVSDAASWSPTPPPPPRGEDWTVDDVYNGASYAAERRPMHPPIVLGTQFLQHFIVHAELRRNGPRVGLAPRYDPVPPLDRAAWRAASCAPQATCVGQQSYVATLNECVQPDCSAFFQALDESTGVCVRHSSFVVAVTVILAIFGSAELALQTLHTKWTARYAREANAATQVRASPP